MSLRARVRVDFPGCALDADLALPEHGISAVFGPSGAGKSTLLRAVAGLERTRGSRIEVAGKTWQDDESALFLPSHKRPLGFVFQHTHLFAHLDVRRNLEFGMKRVPAGERRIPLAQAVELLDIGHLLARRPDTLSGGERQRVGIARALATSPRVLLLDEPLSALDMGLKAEIMPYLERLNRELRLPMLYVTHALDEVARLADWLVLLDAGRVTAAGPTAELLTRLDLPLAHGDTAAAVIEGEVVELDPDFRLATVAFCGECIQLADEGVSLGQRVRLRVQARDVSLTLERQSGTSILNSIEVAVSGIADEGRSQAMVALDAGGARLLSRITRKSAAALNLRPGMRLFAQVKGVAVIG